MYSRKYIRSSMPVSAAAIPRGGREVSPPPDYTGMAFAADRQNRQDFPETLIPEHPAPAEDFFEKETAEPNAEPVIEPTALFQEALTSESEEASEEVTLPYEEETVSETVFAESVPEMAQGWTPAETSPTVSEEPPEIGTPAPTEETADAPLLTLSLLKSLTLEDLMLYWMLLMLLLSEQEDQIYLLLGLLLFSR